MVQIQAKVSRGNVNPPLKHIHSRISYLYQAATYLAQTSLSQQRIRMGSTGNNRDAAVLDTSFGDRQDEAVAADGSQKSGANATVTDEDVAQTDGLASLPLSTAIGLPCLLLSHVRAVSMKSQIRLLPTMKHTICKRCDILLVPGSTSTRRMENKSRGGKKRWADVLVVSCNLCGTSKRFPVGAKRQHRRCERSSELGGQSLPDRATNADVSGLEQATAHEPAFIISGTSWPPAGLQL